MKYYVQYIIAISSLILMILLYKEAEALEYTFHSRIPLCEPPTIVTSCISPFLFDRHLHTVDNNGRIIVVDPDAHTNIIRVLDSNGNQLFAFGSRGTDNGQFISIYGIFVDSNNRIIVGDTFIDRTNRTISRIQVFNSVGNFQFAFNLNSGKIFGLLMAIDKNDMLYVATSTESLVLTPNIFKIDIYQFSDSGLILKGSIGSWGAGAGELIGTLKIEFDDTRDRIIILDFGPRVHVFGDIDGDGIRNDFLFTIGPIADHVPAGWFNGLAGLADGEFNRAMDVEVDSKGRIIVADTFNHRIQIFDSSGIFLTKFGRFAFPEDIVIHGVNGRFNFPSDIEIDLHDRILVMDAASVGPWNAGIQIFREIQQMPVDITIVDATIRDGLPAILPNSTLIIQKKIDICEAVQVLAKVGYIGGSIREANMSNISDDIWQAEFEPPHQIGITAISIFIDCPEETEDFPDNLGDEDITEIGDMLFFDPSGTIFESCTGVPLNGAKVTLLVESPEGSNNFVVATSGFLPEENPQITGNDGKYSWQVITGKWKIMVEKEDYITEFSDPVTIPPPVINLNLLLERSVGCSFGTVDISREILSVNQVTTLTLTMDNEGFDNANILVWNVEEPDGDICTANIDLNKIILHPSSSISMDYPDNFILSGLDDENNGDNECNTNNIGIYVVNILTNIGDPIIKSFDVSFIVIPESSIGILAMVAIPLVLLGYWRMRRIVQH